MKKFWEKNKKKTSWEIGLKEIQNKLVVDEEIEREGQS